VPVGPTRPRTSLPQRRPLILASGITVIAAALALNISDGHSPFAAVAVADQPIAELAVAAPDPTTTPEAIALSDETATPDDPSPTPRPAKVKAASTPRPRVAAAASPATAPSKPRPTAKPTPRPTAKPKPTPKPTAAPAQDTPTLAVDVRNGNPALSWTTCTSEAFKAYAVVRSTDSEIHYPPEDHDTVVAMVTSRADTRQADTGAAAGVRVWYRVWCLSRTDNEYKTIWRTPTVSVTP